MKYIDGIIVGSQNICNSLDSINSDAGDAYEFSLHER